MNYQPALIMAIGGAVAAFGTDLDAFTKAREKDPETRFDWTLSIARIVKGAIYAALPGLGLGAVQAN